MHIFAPPHQSRHKNAWWSPQKLVADPNYCPDILAKRHNWWGPPSYTCSGCPVQFEIMEFPLLTSTNCSCWKSCICICGAGVENITQLVAGMWLPYLMNDSHQTFGFGCALKSPWWLWSCASSYNASRYQKLLEVAMYTCTWSEPMTTGNFCRNTIC